MSAHALPSPRSGLRRLRPLARRSDDELRTLAAGGDAGAFAELYERHHQALYRYCRSIVRHDEDARDALHSTWTNAWAALRSGDRDVPVRPWLFRIAHNEAISVLRRRREHDDLDGVVTAAAGGVEDDVHLRERVATLRSDLAELPERQRAALLLRELAGLAHEEIAQVFGVSASAAKQSIYEARRALQEAEEGRGMTCLDVQRLLSDGDGRVRRGRKLRAHLRACDACAGFDAALRRRPADLALLAPPLPAAVAAGLLARFLAHAGSSAHGGGTGALISGAAGASAGSGAAGLATGGASGGLLTVGSKLGAGFAAKLALGAAVVAGAGAGTVGIAHRVAHHHPAAPSAPARTTPGSTSAASTAPASGIAPAGRTAPAAAGPAPGAPATSPASGAGRSSAAPGRHRGASGTAGAPSQPHRHGPGSTPAGSAGTGATHAAGHAHAHAPAAGHRTTTTKPSDPTPSAKHPPSATGPTKVPHKPKPSTANAPDPASGSSGGRPATAGGTSTSHGGGQPATTDAAPTSTTTTTSTSPPAGTSTVSSTSSPHRSAPAKVGQTSSGPAS